MAGTRIEPGQFERIAEFIFNAGPEIPENTLRRMALLLVDTLGVAAGAAKLESGVLARKHAVDFHAAGSADHAARLMFDGRKASIPGAAFAAASQIDNLDGHDGYNPTKGHIGCAVVPALFAFAEHCPDLTGREALQALVMSYEFSARAAISLHATVSDYHTSGAWNALGVAALACRLRQSSADQLRHAVGIAEYHGPRSQMMREIDNPTMLHDGSGMGALTGSMACLLAERGFTGAPAVTLEAPEVGEYWQDLGSLWTVDLNYIKPYPICRWAHAAIDATRLLMREHHFAAKDVEAVTVLTFAQAARLYRGMPKTTSEAQYSLAFAVATMLLHGTIAPQYISGDGLGDERIAALLPSIEIIEAERHSSRFPLARWSDVEIILKDGRRLSSGDVHARGGPEAPMEEAEIEAKFHTMTASALSPKRAKAIWAMRERLLQPGVKLAELSNLIYGKCDV